MNPFWHKFTDKTNFGQIQVCNYDLTIHTALEYLKIQGYRTQQPD
jgi:hypothetical protein